MATRWFSDGTFGLEARVPAGGFGGELCVRALYCKAVAITVARSMTTAACLAVVMILGAAPTAVAHEPDADATAGFYERLAFDVADTDGDGLVSEAELARDAAAGFSGLDTDRSETLTPDELGPHDPAMFARVDRNGDGALTFSEVMIHKTLGFEAGDENQDGRLSFEEMVEQVQAERGAR
jgi:hypothetical protein